MSWTRILPADRCARNRWDGGAPDGLLAPGCSPGTSDLPDGIWFGRIERASDTSIEFDLMCFGPGPEGPGTISSTNPKLRTVPVESDTVVYAIVQDGYWQAMTWDEWYPSPPPANAFCPPEGCWDVWLYVNDGAVTEVVQLWFP